MEHDDGLRGWRRAYAVLVRLYPPGYRARFGEGMEQTFADLLRERRATGGGLFGFGLWVFGETLAGIVREHMTVTTAENKRLIGMLAAIGLLLLVPLVAMQFSEDVVWSWFDFVVAGVVLGGAALAFEFAARRSGNVAWQMAFGAVIAAVLAVVWVQLAVGIVNGTPVAGN